MTAVRKQADPVSREQDHLALDLLRGLVRSHGGTVSQFAMIEYFKTNYPAVPLRVLKEASSSRLIVGDGGLSDSDFERLMRPWFD